MRLQIGAGLFLVAVFAAACGGGGGGAPGALPGTVASPGHGAQLGKASMALHIPKAAATAAGQKRPAYVSPATKSVKIVITPITTPSSTPLPPQIFPVATPTPCTENQDGSKTCTFPVEVAYGQDSVEVFTYAVTDPGPNDVPLNTFTTTLSVSPGSTPPPVTFNMNGNVNYVGISIASPEPSFTPNTRIITAASPYPAQAIAITPYDASGTPILTDAFSTPITIQASPSAGVKLQIQNSQCSPKASDTPSTSVQITCAADLANVKYLYDGSVTYDGSHNVQDTIVVSASPASSPVPSGASPSSFNVRLASTTVTYPMAMTTTWPDWISNAKNSDGSVTYLLADEPPSGIGHFDPNHPTVQGQYADLNYVSYGLAVSNGGSIWVSEPYDSGYSPAFLLNCYSGISSTPAVSINVSVPGGQGPLARRRMVSASDPLMPQPLARDSQGNIWFAGNDYNTDEAWAGYIPASQSDCSTAPSVAQATIDLGVSDYVDDISPLATGVMILTDSDLFKADTSSASPLSPFAPIPGGYYGSYLKTDSAGDALVTLDTEGPGALGFYPAGMTTPTLFSGPSNMSVAGLDLFPTTGNANRFSANDENYGTVAVGDVTTQTATWVPTAGNDCLGTFFDANGDAWAECDAANGFAATHAIRTSVWSLIAPPQFIIEPGQPIALLSTGNPGPFSLGGNSDPTYVSLSSDSSWAPFTSNLAFNVTGTSSNGVTLTVNDTHGRSESTFVPIGSPTSCPSICSGARRANASPHGRLRLRGHRSGRPFAHHPR